MCRTVLIDNTFCRHRHAEIQKCNDILYYEDKRERSIWRSIFTPSTIPCRHPQQTMTYFKAQFCPDCKKEQERQERRQRRPQAPPGPAPSRNPDNSEPSPLQRRNAMRVPETQRPQPTQRRQPPSSTDVADRSTWRPDAQARDRSNPQPQRVNRYMDRPLPPVPLQPHRDSAPPSSSSGPSGSQGQRPRAQSQSRGSQGPSQQQGPQRRGSMSQANRPPSTGYRPVSIQHPRPRPGAIPHVVTHDWDDMNVPSPQSTPPTPPTQQTPQRRASASVRKPTPSSISRMDEQINSAERAWSNAGPSSSSRRPSVSGPSGSGSSRGFVNPVPQVPQAYPTRSLTDPRNHRSQREGKYA